MITVTRTSNNTPTSLYRYYDRHGALIYVGITGRGITRNREHNERAEWWQFVARQEVDHFENRTAALAAERRLIGTYLPPFNTQHNPFHVELRAEYLEWERADVADVKPGLLVNRLQQRLPLVPLLLSNPNRFVLRSRLEHYSIANRLRGLEGVEVVAPKLIGRVTEGRMRAGRLLLMVEPSKQVLAGSRVVPDLRRMSIAAPFRYLEHDTPTFKVPRIEIEPIARPPASNGVHT